MLARRHVRVFFLNMPLSAGATCAQDSRRARLGPGRWLLEHRLEQCRADLEDPTRSHWTIADIAVGHGFNDPSYFTRVFRGRYEITPREHRRHHGTSASGPAAESAPSHRATSST